jgi:hypothetical protein
MILALAATMTFAAYSADIDRPMEMTFSANPDKAAREGMDRSAILGRFTLKRQGKLVTISLRVHAFQASMNGQNITAPALGRLEMVFDRARSKNRLVKTTTTGALKDGGDLSGAVDGFTRMFDGIDTLVSVLPSKLTQGDTPRIDDRSVRVDRVYEFPNRGKFASLHLAQSSDFKGRFVFSEKTGYLSEVEVEDESGLYSSVIIK